MTGQIHKYSNGSVDNPIFSILIPSWNNLGFLKLCIASIQQHSRFQHQIIVIANEGRDGTLEWLKASGLDFIHAAENIGICFGLNACRSLIRADHIVYFNDDMYALPDWDVPLWEEILKLDGTYFMLSATLIEPMNTGNPCVIVQDFGDTLEQFREAELLNGFRAIPFHDWLGSTWPPVATSLELWDLIGGMSIEFSPGMYSDPDLSMKAYVAGTRVFRGLAESRVYHFGSKTTGRTSKNNGRSMFLQKWHLSAADFMHETLQRGRAVDQAQIAGQIRKGGLPSRLKRMWDVFK
jgi:glycosyltransferase involved in cell wall biosynthesis